MKRVLFYDDICHLASHCTIVNTTAIATVMKATVDFSANRSSKSNLIAVEPA